MEVDDKSNLVVLDSRALALDDLPLILGLTEGSLLTEVEMEDGTVLLGNLGALLDLLLDTRDSWLPTSLEVSPSDMDFGELDLALVEPELSISIGTKDSVRGLLCDLAESLNVSSSPIIIPESPFSTSSRLPWTISLGRRWLWLKEPSRSTSIGLL